MLTHSSSTPTAFAERLFDRCAQVKSTLCVGLDPALELMPESFLRSMDIDLVHSTNQECADAIFIYCAQIIEVVADTVAVIKPQAAYFERFGSHGVNAMERLIDLARERNLLVVLDAKRGDIGSTSAAYAQAYLGVRPHGIAVDAVTLPPFLGEDSLSPFFDLAIANGRGVFVCAYTSNPGRSLIQERTFNGTSVSTPMAAAPSSACRDQ